MPTRLYWFQRTVRGVGWIATTAPTTDAERVRIERMGYATRLSESTPLGEPTIEEIARVQKWTPELSV